MLVSRWRLTAILTILRTSATVERVMGPCLASGGSSFQRLGNQRAPWRFRLGNRVPEVVAVQPKRGLKRVSWLFRHHPVCARLLPPGERFLRPPHTRLAAARSALGLADLPPLGGVNGYWRVAKTRAGKPLLCGG